MSLDDVVAFVRRTRGARGRPSSGWGSLTPTELEVVKLAAEGGTNPEIGARLFMSRGTVKTHLAHVYAKLGIANRTELATLAATHLAEDVRQSQSMPKTPGPKSSATACTPSPPSSLSWRRVPEPVAPLRVYCQHRSGAVPGANRTSSRYSRTGRRNSR